MEQTLMTVTEAARQLALSRATMSDMVRAGRIPSVRIGPRTVRIPADGLSRWIAERTVAPPAPAVPAAGEE